MDRKLKQELVVLSGIAALGCLMLRQKKPAVAFAALASGLALYPIRPVSFRNRVVVITGGSRGLGLALATEFALQGASIVLLARDEKELITAKNHLLQMTQMQKTRNVMTIKCDVTQKNELKTAFQNIVDNFGRFDVLVNNAGAILVSPYQSARPEDYQAQLDLHLFAPMQTIDLALPYLRHSPIGRIVNICSMGGKVAMPHMLPYDTSKFALAGFSQGMTYELAKEKIPVTTVYPALLQTGSPIHAVFKGNHQKEFAWFASADVMPGLAWPAEKAAVEIVKACAVGQREVILSFLARARMIVASFFPEVMGAFFSLVNRFLPSGQSDQYLTGSQSRQLFDNSIVLKPLQQRSQEAEKKWNQKGREDALYNLGLHKGDITKH